MCYRDNVPALHFDGIQLACLCGDNGHGKSALIDAITWAPQNITCSICSLVYALQFKVDVSPACQVFR